VATEAERTAALAEWKAAVGEPDPAAAQWAAEVIDRIGSDQAAAHAS
jgi:hypothetical protein